MKIYGAVKVNEIKGFYARVAVLPEGPQPDNRAYIQELINNCPVVYLFLIPAHGWPPVAALAMNNGKISLKDFTNTALICKIKSAVKQENNHGQYDSEETS
jgi:hypothetical protein